MRQPLTTFTDAFSGSINALKGLLIIVVVMDHNDLLRAFAPNLFKPLTFHVLGFLLLPFLVPAKPISVQFVRDRLIRYFVPFWWVLTLATLLYSMGYRSGDGVAVVMRDWLAASVLGSAPLVKAASGFFYFWFLPSLAGLVIFLAGFQSLNRRWQVAVAALSIFCHLAITAFPAGALKYLPLGALIVLWVFPLGLMFRRIISSHIVYRLRFPILAAFIGSYGYLVLQSQNIEIMTLDLRSVSKPIMFLMQDTSAILGVLVAIGLASKLNRLRLLNLCGQHSLMVYLFHPLVFVAGMKIVRPDQWGLQGYSLLLVGIMSVMFTALASLALAVLLARIPGVKNWMMPKGWGDWVPAQLAMRCVRSARD